MKLGFMIYSLGRALADKTLTLPQALALIKECGAEGVDVDSWNTKGYSPTELRQMAADAGLTIACHIGGADLTVGDPAARSQALDHLRRVVDDAAEMGTSTVLLTTGVCAEGQDRAEGRRNVAAGLAEILPYAKAAGVTVSIEDFGSPRSPYQTSEECLECCQWAGPDLRITYDSGNMVMGNEDPVSFLLAVHDLVVHAHAKDWELLPPGTENGVPDRSGRRYVGTVVGRGVLDYPEIIAALRSMHYQGYLAFEYEGLGDPIAAAKEGTAYLKQLMEQP